MGPKEVQRGSNRGPEVVQKGVQRKDLDGRFTYCTDPVNVSEKYFSIVIQQPGLIFPCLSPDE